MSKSKIITLFVGLLVSVNLFAQPSDSELKTKVNNYYGSSSGIVSIKFKPAKIEKRWEKNGWTYYWSKKYNVKTKTEYPGVFLLSYGGVQYRKNGNSYTYDKVLGGAPIGYEGIPNPSESEINAHLKSTYDPLNFYNNYMMSYLIEAPNNIKLSANPKWKWTELNTVSFNVVVSYTLKTDNIGGVEEEKGEYRVNLQRSVDGVTFNPDAKLLKNGKWLKLSKGNNISTESIRQFELSKEELKSTKTLAQLNATRHAEEFKKSLGVVKIPEFKSANHLMQFTHELLLEGDKEKVTAFMYQMLPRYYFEEWSDIVLNQNGKRMLGEVIDDLDNYKVAFCQYPIVKEVGSTYVRFYNRNKHRLNRISVSYSDDRWYIKEISYFIMDEDYAKFEQNGDTYCDGNPIFIDGEAQFKTGDKVLVLVTGTWYSGEIMKPEMEKGGYSVIYGRMNMAEWVFASEVKEDPNAVDVDPIGDIKYEIGEEVAVYYSKIWYKGTVLNFSYEKEGYLISIPDRSVEVWTSTSDMEKLKKSKKSEDKKSDSKSNEPKKEEPKKKKTNLKVKVPKVKIKLR